MRSIFSFSFSQSAQVEIGAVPDRDVVVTQPMQEQFALDQPVNRRLDRPRLVAIVGAGKGEGCTR